MSIEQVVCPHCGTVVAGTVPSTHKLVKVEKSSGWYVSNTQYQSVNKCISCGKKYYTITESK